MNTKELNVADIKRIDTSARLTRVAIHNGIASRQTLASRPNAGAGSEIKRARESEFPGIELGEAVQDLQASLEESVNFQRP